MYSALFQAMETKYIPSRQHFERFFFSDSQMVSMILKTRFRNAFTRPLFKLWPLERLDPILQLLIQNTEKH
jgi:hypothetical protein